MSRQSASDYLQAVYDELAEKNKEETEFLQAVNEVFHTLTEVLDRHPEYREHRIIERMLEPEKLLVFRVEWLDDNNNVRINRGYRVQFNSALGPYKGGLRFDPSVNTSVVKFLGFEQMFKNALTGLPIGAGKGGADFDPKGKSDMEIMRFCQAYMTSLWRHLGADTDVPAGDIGVGKQEIGYLYGSYKKLQGENEAGILTGKPSEIGGSLGREQATGYGLVYFVSEMMKNYGEQIEGKKVIVSGSGNVSLHAMEKIDELGGTVVACSDSKGYIFDQNGISPETVKEIKQTRGENISVYTDKHRSASYTEGSEKIWQNACDIALPCATQNELDENAAHHLIENSVKIVAEGANMPCTNGAIEAFTSAGILIGPGKAANAGGVTVSVFEMAQNASHLRWTFREVDEKLQETMTAIVKDIQAAAKQYGVKGQLPAGANIVGFKRVADAMIKLGV
ncbi:glutamate dehydrogenase (NADP+) [Salisediminibacterium halotolerans]|uniref:Glutamate dehydrogenase n=1 Tax=Salisediminibacterium halotolerans TaxID=517425 RepID=A0A1H9WDS3_9BACI|nr:NADP-specific glutamate dehydrogenase [Salisediminibacterium haloalkalitolerans]SES32070.1 glutamate dehydrogenase (NADP+) [Salisediminibacterium haloalkalitolerans]